MPVNLTYIDLLGYSAMEKDNHRVFHNIFEKDFVPFFLSDTDFESTCEYEIYQNPHNIDAFYLLTSRDDNSIDNLIELCRLVSLRQILTIIKYRFTLRGYATYRNDFYLNKTFVPSNVDESLYKKLDFKQKQTRFARVALDKEIANNEILTHLQTHNFLCRVNSKARTYYINPFLPFFDNYFNSLKNGSIPLTDFFYQLLRDSVHDIFDSTKMSLSQNNEPFKKAIWLVLQFDKSIKKNNLKYKTILLGKKLKYAYIYLKKDQPVKNLKYFVISLFKNFSNDSKIHKPYFRILKDKYGKELSYKRLQIAIEEKMMCIIPINIFEIGFALINEIEDSGIMIKDGIDYLYKKLDELYVELLNKLKEQNESSFFGNLLEESRNNFIRRNDIYKITSIFSLKS